MVRSVCDRRTGLFVLVLTLITVALPAPEPEPKQGRPTGRATVPAPAPAQPVETTAAAAGGRWAVRFAAVGTRLGPDHRGPFDHLAAWGLVVAAATGT